MNNSTKTNDVMFISEFTDISKWDLGGLNRITGFTEDETIKEASDDWNENGIFNCDLPGWTSELSDTEGIDDLEKLAEDMQEETYQICSACGEESDNLQDVGGDRFCESCVEKSDRERDPGNMDSYRTSTDYYKKLM